MRASSERGSALLLAILATAVLGAGLMGVLSLSGAERRSIMNQAAQTDAYAVAETGLQQFVVNRTALGFTASPAAAYESTRVNVSGGYADVVLQRLRAATGNRPATYVIRSHGYATSARLSGTPVAERQVAQLATWGGGGSVTTLAAFTAINGLTKQGASGMLSGVDACGAQAATGGVAVGSPGYTQNGASVPAGSPAILSLGTQAAAAAAVPINWDSIVNYNIVTANVTLPGGTWPSFAGTDWPVVRVNGDFTLPSDGRGLLIVTGTLNISSPRTWDGVILVGNAMNITAQVNIQGAIVTGLNVKLGGAPSVSTINTGTRTFQYNSCNVASALGAFGSDLVLMPNAWVDSWAGW